MQYFASLTLAEFAPIITILAGMLIGFYGLLKFVLNQAEKDREAERKERKEFAEALSKVADSNVRVAEATERAAIEAKERNGHLAELQLQSQEMLKTIGDRNYRAITEVQEQHVQHQTVEKETVIRKGKQNVPNRK